MRANVVYAVSMDKYLCAKMKSDFCLFKRKFTHTLAHCTHTGQTVVRSSVWWCHGIREPLSNRNRIKRTIQSKKATENMKHKIGQPEREARESRERNRAGERRRSKTKSDWNSVETKKNGPTIVRCQRRRHSHRQCYTAVARSLPPLYDKMHNIKSMIMRINFPFSFSESFRIDVEKFGCRAHERPSQSKPCSGIFFPIFINPKRELVYFMCLCDCWILLRGCSDRLSSRFIRINII